MKTFFILIFLSSLTVSAQFDTDSVYKFAYRLAVPETDPYQYMEYKSIDWADTGTSFERYLDTIEYDVTIVPLGKDLKPALTSKISILNHEKEVINEFMTEQFINDSIQVKLKPGTAYIAFDCFFRQDTVLFYWHADQIPTRLTLVCSDDGFHWPLLLCKRRLTPKEMNDVYQAVKLGEETELEKCGICYRGSEI